MLHQHRAKRSGDRGFVQDAELPQYIFKQGNSYAVRYTVPCELNEISGKKEVVRTLGPGDLRKAIATRDEIIEAIKRELREPKPIFHETSAFLTLTRTVRPPSAPRRTTG